MSDFLYDTEVITWGVPGKEKSLTVRGLSSEDLTYAIRTHKDALNKMFSFAEEGLEGNSLVALGAELLENFPEVVALLIALASDMKPEMSAQVRKLAAPIQLKLMMAVYRLTIEDTGGLQDFLGLVFGLLQKANQMTHWLNSKPAVANTGT